VTEPLAERGVLAEACAVQIIVEDRRLLVVDTGLANLYRRRLLLAMGPIGAVPVGIAWIGGASATTVGAGVATGLGVAAIVVGLVLTGLLIGAQRAIRRGRARPYAEMTNLAVFDFDEGRFYDGEGRALAPISQVRAGCGLEFTDSPGELLVRYPEGSVSLAKEIPLAGRVVWLAQALQSRGVRGK
jgi:hypothetical protein